MKYCKKCGWVLEYIPRSYQEYIRETLGEQKKRGYWKCNKCGNITRSKKTGVKK